MRHRGTALFCASLALGCAAKSRPTRRPEPRLGPATFASPEALVAAVRRRNDGYRTLRQVHRVSLEIALPDGTRERRSCTGVLIVARPDRFRLTALGPLGLELFDIRWADQHLEVLAVSPELARTSALPGLLRSIGADIRAIYRLGPLPPIERRELTRRAAKGRDRVVLLEYQAGNLWRRLEVLAGSAAVTRADLRLPDARRTVTYDDFRREKGLVLPRTIAVVTQSTTRYRLAIRVRRSEVDVPLAPQVFGR